ncbi:hypothetical protein SEA_BANTAM_159 [Gordonia phage Bantam]|uniref:Uncharacterized protein n=1 Tax=Gordonia phage Bantam TaxID=1887641 RepID=A0A1B3AYK2_9CAUD|nr:hypothetical protein BIZ77_gp020 [Gordonia phage Bantam]AOE43848.1 hypothetical protein SEA_BANTAM_159 [Gordonia phage Bantam]
MPHDIRVGDEVEEAHGWHRGRVVHIDLNGEIVVDWYPTYLNRAEDLVVTTEA